MSRPGLLRSLFAGTELAELRPQARRLDHRRDSSVAFCQPLYHPVQRLDTFQVLRPGGPGLSRFLFQLAAQAERQDIEGARRVVRETLLHDRAPSVNRLLEGLTPLLVEGFELARLLGCGLVLPDPATQPQKLCLPAAGLECRVVVGRESVTQREGGKLVALLHLPEIGADLVVVGLEEG